MSSSYSPDLRLELIGTGDQAGVWGVTTNTNLGTLLEEAIAGYTSVAVIASSQAFTVEDGAEDQARYAMLALTTTTGANFAVYAPPSSKQYIIYNASSYTATIYNSTVAGNTTAAGTGVAIPAGKVMAVWSDGTNVVQQNTHLISPTLASPTLTSAVLGTPASGTLTNCSGLPVATGISGLGTGVATALAVNVGTAGAPVVNGGALGTPSSGTLTNCTFPTLNQNTTGTAAGLSVTLLETSGGTGTTVGYSGFKNRIINGAMKCNQYGASATLTAGGTIANGYTTVDRFYAYCTGANVSVARVAGSGSTQYRWQATGAASVTAIGFGQRIEQKNCFDLAGTTATLSVELANSLLTTVTWVAYYANSADTFGTLASPTRTQIATGTFTVTSTATTYNAQISIPSAATTGIEVVFTVGAQTSGTWTVGNVQLEKGATATAFEYHPFSVELSASQRYAYAIQTNAYYAGMCISTTSAYIPIPFPIPMRVSPTLNLTGPAGSVLNSSGATVSVTSFAQTTGSTQSLALVPTVSSGLTAGNATCFVASAPCVWSAEL